MSAGQSKPPSDSIKVIPGRSKLRVESSNPVARGNPIPKTTKVKLISPEEAIHLSFGATQTVVAPISESPRPNHALATSEPPRPKRSRATFESPRPEPARATSEAPKPIPVRPTSEAPRLVLAHPAAGFRKEIVCGLRALSLTTITVRQKPNTKVRQSRTVEPPPSPRALHIRSGDKEQAANATQVVEGDIF